MAVLFFALHLDCFVVLYFFMMPSVYGRERRMDLRHLIDIGSSYSTSNTVRQYHGYLQ